MEGLTLTDLTGVVYSAGKVFDGLSSNRLSTERFLASNSTDGINSKQDLFLLQDLRDVATTVLERAGAPVDADLLISLNSRITRSGSLHPGQFRTATMGIGVTSVYGRHEPVAIDRDGLQALIEGSLAREDPVAAAIDLFIEVAKAQPFQDGNKRSALFAANAHLIGHGTGTLLTIPVSETSLKPAERFNDLLARAYIFDDHEPVAALLRQDGLVSLDEIGSRRTRHRGS